MSEIVYRLADELEDGDEIVLSPCAVDPRRIGVVAEKSYLEDDIVIVALRMKASTEIATMPRPRERSPFQSSGEDR